MRTETCRGAAWCRRVIPCARSEQGMTPYRPPLSPPYRLPKALAQVYAGNNPAGAWFMAASACLFCATFFGLLLLLIPMVVQK